MRMSVAAAVSCLTFASLAAAEYSAASVRQETQIPAQRLGEALHVFARDRQLQLVYATDEVENLRSGGAVGYLSAVEALTQLLQGTGLTYQFLDEKTVTMQPRAAAYGGAPVHNVDAASVWSRFRLARMDQGGVSGGGSNPAPSEPTASGEMIEEIIVSAQKRDERLQDVPIPVSVLDTTKLIDNGQVLIRDYYNKVPGFNMAAYYGFTQNLAIRGITTGGFSNPTVAITVDDVPYGSSINNAGSNQVPDIDPGDLARIEVLRGPQGTFYGANSMGGLVKYVTKDPSTSHFSGQAEAGFSSVAEGEDPGYNVRASANVPLGETLAMRISGYTRQDPGYIDNPVTAEEDVNEAISNGARVAFLWAASDIMSVKFSALYQRTEVDGVADVHTPTAGFAQTVGLRDLQQINMPGTGTSERKVQAYSAHVDIDLGSATLSSVTGYNINEYTHFFDRTVGLAGLLRTPIQNHFGVTGIVGNDVNSIKKFSQELRLASAGEQKLQWMIGAFYTREDSRALQRFYGADEQTGEIVGLEWARNNPYFVQELSGFANLTYHFTDRFDVQVGGRLSRNEEEDDPYVQTGPFVGGAPVIAPALDTSSDTFTHLLTPRFKLSPNVMVYGRWASGYRAGGPNFPAPGAPASYEPDKTQNYELGLKGDFLGGALSIDASIYYIDWEDIQLSLRPQTIVFQANGGRAKSEGVEFSVTARPWTDLTISGWVAYNNAELTEPFPAGSTAFGIKGSRLPNSARLSGHLSIDQEFALGISATGFVGAAATYTGDRVSLFTSTPVRQVFPSYTKVDLRAGVLRDSWTANLYVNNLTDERGVIAGGLSYQPIFGFVYIQPRTIGVSLSKAF